jgi:hypothetical protein
MLVAAMGGGEQRMALGIMEQDERTATFDRAGAPD